MLNTFIIIALEIMVCLWVIYNDLDLQTDELKLYGCLPVVMQCHTEFVLLNHIQKYETTIASLLKGYAFL